VRPIRSIILIAAITGIAYCQESSDSIAHAHVRTFDLEIIHPSFPDNFPQKKELLVYMDERAYVLAYAMEVESVICLETKCEVIPVQLLWNAIGQYAGFKLPEGSKLTKMDHVVFTEDDYRKLDQILGNPDSLLKGLSSQQIVEPEKAVKTADGVSAPTPVSMQNAVVAGAVYTCYTLWHWVNGDTAHNIKKITSELTGRDQLLEFFYSGEKAFVEFAVDQLISRKAFDPDTLDRIAANMHLGENTMKSALRYLAAASVGKQSFVYHDAIQRVFQNCGLNERICMLESLVKSSLVPPEGFYDNMSRFLPELETYYEVHMLLELERRNNPGSGEVVHHAMKLLDNSNFLIARRAFWFLMETSLDPQQRILVEAFQQKYQDRI